MWFGFYHTPINIAGYAALYIHKQRDEDDIFLIELTRCSDQRASKHFAFTDQVACCRVISCQEVRNSLSEVAWDEALEIARDASQMVARSEGKSTPKPVIAFITPD
jgi:hypothetical protein